MDKYVYGAKTSTSRINRDGENVSYGRNRLLDTFQVHVDAENE